MERLSMFLFFLLANNASIQAQSPSAEGIWESPDHESRIEIYKCSNNLCAKVIWLEPTLSAQESEFLDTENPDSQLRSRPLLGLVFLKYVEKTGNQNWSGGEIYDIESGESYSAKLELETNNSLKISGCWSFLCEGEVWKRIIE
ncbi:MAG: hypothetical protein CL693_15925 [Cellvibrionaceae bacterium]|nr:hypothetical protein [Cellvibrionaceae bacterium]|tara:strand:+ start:213 stop:644 length:432 start_codon:yes stop_codon:yes gene_type:complete